MSHLQQIKAIKIIKESLVANKNFRIMEVGSYDVNGSIKSIFEYEKYYGIDLAPGPNVDIVGSGHEIDLISEDINLCISSECFEHNPFWKETMLNMARHLHKGGFIVVTTAITGRLEHGTFRTDPKHSPGTSSIGWSYYKNIRVEEFQSFIKTLPGFKESYIFTQSITFDLYAVILLGDSPEYRINSIALKKIERLKKLDFSIKGLAFQFWLFPMRIAGLFLNDNNYLTLGVFYERFTKRLIKDISAKIFRINGTN